MLLVFSPKGWERSAQGNARGSKGQHPGSATLGTRVIIWIMTPLRHSHKPPRSRSPRVKAVVFDRYGPAAEVLAFRDGVAKPSPGRGEVLVRMLASPLNPSDLLYT